MITQNVLNWFAGMLTVIVDALPDIPTEFYQIELHYYNAINVVEPFAERFGVIVPWDTVTAVIILLLTLIPVWVGTLAVRVLLWAVGR